jgi:hypothetical protein
MIVRRVGAVVDMGCIGAHPLCVCGIGRIARDHLDLWREMPAFAAVRDHAHPLVAFQQCFDHGGTHRSAAIYDVNVVGR